MLATILDFIKTIMEKYGMITLLSFLAGIVTVSLLPDKVIDILPFEEQNIYWALITGIIAWIVIFSVLHRICKKIVASVSSIKYTQGYEKEKISEYKQNVHDFFDEFNEKEKKMILNFLEKNNEPITMSEYNIKYTIPHIYSRQWLHITEKQTAVKEEFIDAATGKKYIGTVHHSHILKLRDDIYSTLLAIYKEDGKLGNF